MTVLYIILALLLFGVLIFVHELGHYIAARICKVKVLEFAIGMGPKLIKWESKKTGTKYSLRLLPVGGFCAMKGEGDYDNPDGRREGDESPETQQVDTEDDTDPESYKNKPAWMKMIILAAGAFMNILVGFLMTVVLVLGSRDADGKIVLASNTVAKFTENAISEETGLMVGDKVIKVGNVAVHTGTELAYEITNQGKRPEDYPRLVGTDTEVMLKVVSLDLTVIRNGEKIRLEGVKFLAEEAEGAAFGSTDFYALREKVGFLSIIKHVWFRSLNSIKMVWDSLIGLLTGRFSLSSVSGPVGTTQVITQAASMGWYTLVYIFVIIAMNLGVFNLLPFLPLDGGHIVFAFYELVARKPAPKKVMETCQLVGVVLMFGLMIVVTVKDVINLF